MEYKNKTTTYVQNDNDKHKIQYQKKDTKYTHPGK